MNIYIHVGYDREIWFVMQIFLMCQQRKSCFHVCVYIHILIYALCDSEIWMSVGTYVYLCMSFMIRMLGQ